ncbi:unknown [Prevotella sp. CAG:1185]|jgi:hypothetical protein|uniref:hypothetical protein n=1 Tax=Xylanibacter rarus TaxID=1676614 RepID=UPI000334F17F|nr:hypothetical protein [Xylanibacter rarus]CCY84349.1 unknown [Prevotella sp. CAG:1185]
MKMKKEYVSPSIQVLQIESENILSGSVSDGIPGMDGLPSDPGYYDYEEEY